VIIEAKLFAIVFQGNPKDGGALPMQVSPVPRGFLALAQ
jgi:hypothetical protein